MTATSFPYDTVRVVVFGLGLVLALMLAKVALGMWSRREGCRDAPGMVAVAVLSVVVVNDRLRYAGSQAFSWRMAATVIGLVAAAVWVHHLAEIRVPWFRRGGGDRS